MHIENFTKPLYEVIHTDYLNLSEWFGKKSFHFNVFANKLIKNKYFLLSDKSACLGIFVDFSSSLISWVVLPTRTTYTLKGCLSILLSRVTSGVGFCEVQVPPFSLLLSSQRWKRHQLVTITQRWKKTPISDNNPMVKKDTH